jgi:hypothetical protein
MRGSLIMSGNHTLLESLSSDPSFGRILKKYKQRKTSTGGSSSYAYNSKNNSKPPGGGRRPSSSPPNDGGGIGKYLLGIGAGGVGGYALRDKLGDVTDDTGEHINSLRDKLANIIATHHEEV